MPGGTDRWWNDRRTIGGLAISALSLAGVVWWAMRQESPPWPQGGEAWGLIALAVCVDTLANVLRSWRWHRILRLDGVALPFRHALGLTFVGYMGNTVLPLRGGEVLRIMLVRRETAGGRRQILSSILAERSLDALVLVAMFVVLTLVAAAGAPLGVLPAVLAGAGLVLAAAGLGLYLRLRRSGRLTKFADTVRPVVRGFRPLIGRDGVGPLAASIVVWLLVGVIFLLVARSLELDIGLSEGVFLAIFGSALAIVPAAPGYVGTFDAAIIFGLGTLGFSGSVVVGFAVLIRLVLFVPATTVGLALVLGRYGGFAAARAAQPDRA